jgi:5-methylcytosine-specific restriction endonuclease McrA
MMIGRPKAEIRARESVIRKDLTRRYDTDSLRTELYGEQSGNCFLCGKRIQSSDSMVCEIEHAVPVDLYAEFDWPIEKACEQANDRKNLFAAHRRCNKSKHNRDYEEWIADGSKERLRDVPDLSEEEIARLRKEFTERSRVSGRRGGYKTKENGTGVFAPGVQAKNARLGGLKTKELGIGVFAPENRGKGGHKTKELGTGIFGMTHEQHQEAGRRARRAGGRTQPREAKVLGNHIRWHTKRGIVNPNCPLCNPSKGNQ